MCEWEKWWRSDKASGDEDDGLCLKFSRFFSLLFTRREVDSHVEMMSFGAACDVEYFKAEPSRHTDRGIFVNDMEML